MGVVLGEFFSARKALIATALAGVLAVAPAMAAHADVDPGDRGSVASGYTDVYAKAVAVPIGWTGAVSSCTAGTTSEAATQATLDAINYVRALGSLDPVTFDPALSAKAQEAALVYEANRALSHSIPTDWKCRTSNAAKAGQNSNIALGAGGARAIGLYMSDPGAGNTAAGHRRWIMNPDALTFGTGSTTSANALWVFGATSSSQAAPTWVSWPTAGYFPSQLEPGGRWSLTSAGANFESAKVKVVNSSGTAVPVTKTYTPQDGYADPTLVWEMGSIPRVSGTAVTSYTVTVSGIKRGSSSGITRSYTIDLIDATAAVNSFESTADPVITGFPRIGQVLTATAGSFSPEATKSTYRWYRSGKAISGATKATYKLTASDKGKAITVRVTSGRDGYESVTKSRSVGSTIGSAIYPAATSTPSLVGSRRVGLTLAISGGEYSVGDAALTYRWYRSGKLISGATSSEYALTKSDLAKKITARVVASAPGYSARAFTVKGGGKVLLGTQVAVESPAIVVADGQVTTTRGTYTVAPSSYVYRWSLGGKTLKTTASGFAVPKAATGKTLVLKITAKKGGYKVLTQRVSVVIP